MGTGQSLWGKKEERRKFQLRTDEVTKKVRGKTHTRTIIVKKLKLKSQRLNHIINS